MSPEDRSNEEIRANFAAAHEWVSDLCTGKRQWRMRVPVDAGDSDIVLSQAISDGEALLARIAAVEAPGDIVGEIDQSWLRYKQTSQTMSTSSG